MTQQEQQPMNVQRKLSDSTQSDSSYETNSGGSRFESSGPQSSDGETSLSTLASPKPDSDLSASFQKLDLDHSTSIPKPAFDPNIAIFSGIRRDPIEDLTGRVKASSPHPFFEGAYSNVWTGMLDDKRPVAIKCLKKQQIRLEKAQRRLKREVGTWWCLRHENIIPLLGLVNDDTFGLFGTMVSPLYKNGSAATYLSNPERPISIAGRIDLFYGVANGLHYLHTFDTTKIIREPATGSEDELKGGVIGIVHGDLKPSNIIIDDNGVPMLCDFGLACIIREGLPTGVTTTSSHTGTIRYVCYELVADPENSELDYRHTATTASDVHALASVGLEFLYSTPPYANIRPSGRADYKITKAIENKVPPAVRPDGVLGIVSTLWNTLEHCWSIEPGNRPDARAVCDYLHRNRDDLIAAMK